MVGRYFLPSFSHTSAPSFNLLPLPGAESRFFSQSSNCQELHQQKLSADLVTLNALLGACSRVQRWEEAMDLLRAAQQSRSALGRSRGGVGSSAAEDEAFFGGQDRSHIVGVVFKLFSHYNSPLVRGFVVDVMFWTPRVSSKSVNNH